MKKFAEIIAKPLKPLGASTSESFDAPPMKWVLRIRHRSLSVNQPIINPSIALPDFSLEIGAPSIIIPSAGENLDAK